MNALLAVIAVLGLAALIISAYIFAVAARSFVSGEESDMDKAISEAQGLVPRRSNDRRKTPPPASFPITVNGVAIPEDRRKAPDRRKRPLLSLIEAGS